MLFMIIVRSMFKSSKAKALILKDHEVIELGDNIVAKPGSLEELSWVLLITRINNYV